MRPSAASAHELYGEPLDIMTTGDTNRADRKGDDTMNDSHRCKRAKTTERAASEARIQKAQADTRAIVAAGKCPICGARIRRNLSIAGWYQCEQLGAEGFRKDPTKPSCSWQGFTE